MAQHVHTQPVITIASIMDLCHAMRSIFTLQTTVLINAAYTKWLVQLYEDG